MFSAGESAALINAKSAAFLLSPQSVAPIRPDAGGHLFSAATARIFLFQEMVNGDRSRIHRWQARLYRRLGRRDYRPVHSVSLMPSVSPKQKKFMAWAASSPENAKKAGISQDVAKDFHSADRRKSGSEKVADAMKRK